MGFFTKTKSQNDTKCNKSGSELYDSNRLERHMKIAHDKKNEKCRNCGKEFRYPEDLRKHKKKCR